jgi:hypothetical protein
LPDGTQFARARGEALVLSHGSVNTAQVLVLACIGRGDATRRCAGTISSGTGQKDKCIRQCDCRGRRPAAHALAAPQPATGANEQRDNGGPCRAKRSGSKYLAIKSGAARSADRRSGTWTGARRWVALPRGCYGQCGGTQCICG